jgi:N-hydroxyarylamine O-acetyltransferase
VNVQAYLDRIGYRGSLAPTPATLRDLHVAHLQTVPFENLSIHAGQPIILTEEALFEKIVVRRRGGFCYELNGLFAALLRTLGFEVDLLAAGVARAGGAYSPDFDHVALAVSVADRLTERWLVDVGFGDSFREPLRLDERGEQVESERGDRAYRIDEDGPRLLLQREGAEGAWEPQFRFTLQPRALADCKEMCLYHQTSPQSHFTQRRICSLATPDGRITLSDLRLIITHDGVRQERMLESEAEHTAALRELFGIGEPGGQKG